MMPMSMIILTALAVIFGGLGFLRVVISVGGFMFRVAYKVLYHTVILGGLFVLGLVAGKFLFGRK